MSKFFEKKKSKMSEILEKQQKTQLDLTLLSRGQEKENFFLSIFFWKFFTFFFGINFQQKIFIFQIFSLNAISVFKTIFLLGPYPLWSFIGLYKKNWYFSQHFRMWNNLEFYISFLNDDMHFILFGLQIFTFYSQ